MKPRTLIPLALFAAIAIGLGVGLNLQPRNLPSALVGQPAPAFALEAVRDFGPALSSENLIGEVSILNVFASWCLPCLVEHPLWVEVAEAGEVALFGLNYKDLPENAAAWLRKNGNPYQRTGADLDGRVGIDWGVYGVPETFIVDAAGTVRHRHVGPIDRYVLETELLPLIRELKAN